MVKENINIKLAVIIYRVLSAAGRVNTLYLACVIHGVKIYIILNSGAALEFINSKFIRYYNLLYLLKKKPKNKILIIINGHTQPLLYKINLTTQIQDHLKIITYIITDINVAPVILGYPWLEEYNLYIN